VRRASELGHGWTLRLDGDLPVPGQHPPEATAAVPGCVHLDLLAAGLIDDPYVDCNELDQRWIGERAWTYELAFTTEPAEQDERVDILFGGIDGVATITLNDVVLGPTANQHRAYRFDVTDIARAGRNDLTVAFASPVEYAVAQRQLLGDLPNPFGQPYNFIRKMACNFGWDWGPRLTTSGLWRPVTLERWRGVRLRAVRPTPRLPTPGPRAGEGGRVDVAVEIERGPGAGGTATVVATLRGPTGDIVGKAETAIPDEDATVAVTVPVPHVERWWPAGRGDQPLYELDVIVRIGDVATDRAVHQLGFRDVQLDTTVQPGGRNFALIVNDERVWVRGVNWIPADCFPSRVTTDLIADRLGDARAANANLVRVWGGGIYESDAFYECCDRLGMLVWQDFAFACAAYPETDLHDEVAAEATDNVTRLMPHPSLALWCGNNECLEGWSDWGWRDAVGERPWGEGFYRVMLPAVVASLDPSRPYIDGTPTSIDPALAPQDPAHGTVHLWDVWNELDYDHYRSHRPRFVAEFGFQAPPAAATLGEACSERPLTAASPAVAHHQRASDGARKLATALERHFGAITDFDDWLYCTQVNQAKALETGVGHFRSLHDRCSGVIWWQLDDCWPAISWAVVDRAGRRKPAWYAMRRAFADRLAVFDPTGPQLALVLVNDGRSPWEARVAIERVAPSGKAMAAADVAVNVQAGGMQRVVIPPDVAPAGHNDLTIATVGGMRSTYHPLIELDQDVERSEWDVEISFTTRSVTVDVTATTLVRDLCLFADRVDPGAEVDDQLVTLLPGEVQRFTVDTPSTPDEAAWTLALAPAQHPSRVLRAAGDRR
jgi:beta-mannosidase